MRAAHVNGMVFVLVCSCALGGCESRQRRVDPELQFWLENMVRHHRYSREEVAQVVDLEDPEVLAAYERLREESVGTGSEKMTAEGKRSMLLPYPGGRHPRIGFLDGAIDPHRDTKASVFLPWSGAGYVVVDLPEAVWGNGRLQYLAHTHIPTVWDDHGVELERLDWRRLDDGSLSEHRVLPDGVELRMRAVPIESGADLFLEIHNGSSEALTEVRAQVCVLLKGAPLFNQQIDENKVALGETMAVRSPDGSRWLAVTWEAGRAWGNPPCPCLHSDPAFGDLAAGETVARRGRLFFYQGADLESEVERRRSNGTLLPAAPGTKEGAQ